jgi:hypothetical protein
MPSPVGDGIGCKLFLINVLVRGCSSGKYLPKVVLAHEKAVPAMMGFCHTRPYHGGTANGQRKDAEPPATAGQIVDRLNAGVSHT